MKRNIKEIYTTFANKYDKIHFYPNSAAEYVEKRRLNLLYLYLQKSKGLRVLDVACGTGSLLDEFNKRGFELLDYEGMCWVPAKQDSNSMLIKIFSFVEKIFLKKNSFSPTIIIVCKNRRRV